MRCLLSTGWATTADEDNTHEEEDDDGRELQDRDPELLFGVSENTKQADDADCEEENDDPDGNVYVSSPLPPLHGETSNDEFEWKNNSLPEIRLQSCLGASVYSPIEKHSSNPLQSPRKDR